MATIALDIHGQGVAVQPYQHTVQELTDVIVRHLARFRRVALRLLGNIADAEDAVQDALLSAFTHLDQFGGQAKMSTWLTSIVINAARMKLRQRSPQAQISLDETHGEQPSAGRDAARPPTKPRRGMLQAGTCRKTRRSDNATLAYVAQNLSTSRPGRLEHQRNRNSPRSARRYGKGSALKGSCKTKGNREKEPPRKR